MAGLVIGAKHFQADTKIMGFSDTPQTHYDAQWVTQLANQIAELIETDIRVSPNEFSIFWEYAGEDYDIPTKEGVKMISAPWRARSRGISGSMIS